MERNQVTGFIRSAETYCSLIESREDYSLFDFLNACTRALPELYLEASQLPKIDSESDEILIESISSEHWQILFKSLGSKLGEYVHYAEVFDPVILSESESLVGNLADDLADIYMDVKKGLLAIEFGSIDEIVWQWKFDFESHWGDHLTTALRVIHSIVHNHWTKE